MTISSVMKDLFDIEKADEISTISLEKYKNFFPESIIRFFFFKHRFFYEDFKEFDDVEIGKIEVNEETISTEDVFKIKYCQFCNLRDESRAVYDSDMLSYYFEKHFESGTWDYPLVLIRKDNDIYAVDGMNRLRLYRCYRKFTNNKLSDKHKVYFLN